MNGFDTSTGFSEFHPLDEYLSTRPQLLNDIPRQARIDLQMDIISRHHERIATSIRMFWGTRDCTEFIRTLIANGSDRDGKAKVGFKSEVVSALLALIDLDETKH
jgi:hypothetical protein